MPRERIGFTPAQPGHLLQILSDVEIKPFHIDPNKHVNHAFYPRFCVEPQQTILLQHPELCRPNNDLSGLGKLHVLFINEAKEGNCIAIETSFAQSDLGADFTHNLTRDGQDIARVRWIVGNPDANINPAPLLQTLEQRRTDFLESHPEAVKKIKDDQLQLFIPELHLAYATHAEQEDPHMLSYAVQDNTRLRFTQRAVLDGTLAMLTCDVIVIKNGKVQRVKDIAHVLGEEAIV